MIHTMLDISIAFNLMSVAATFIVIVLSRPATGFKVQLIVPVMTTDLFMFAFSRIEMLSEILGLGGAHFLCQLHQFRSMRESLSH